MQRSHRFGEGLVGVFVKIRHRNTRGQQRKIRVAYGHRCRRLRCEAVQLGGCHAIVQALDDSHGHRHGIDKGAQPIAKLLDAGRDFVKFDGFFAAIAL